MVGISLVTQAVYLVAILYRVAHKIAGKVFESYPQDTQVSRSSEQKQKQHP